MVYWLVTGGTGYDWFGSHHLKILFKKKTFVRTISFLSHQNAVLGFWLSQFVEFYANIVQNEKKNYSKQSYKRMAMAMAMFQIYPKFWMFFWNVSLSVKLLFSHMWCGNNWGVGLWIWIFLTFTFCFRIDCASNVKNNWPFLQYSP